MSRGRKSETNPAARLQEALEKLASRDRADLGDRLVNLLAVVVEEAAVRPSFARRLTKALSQEIKDGGGQPRRRSRSQRRPPGVLDPFELYKDGEDELRQQLETLDVEQLKDIIAEHGMDRDRLAMKWRTPRRLIERIVETVSARVSKGDVFRD